MILPSDGGRLRCIVPWATFTIRWLGIDTERTSCLVMLKLGSIDWLMLQMGVKSQVPWRKALRALWVQAAVINITTFFFVNTHDLVTTIEGTIPKRRGSINKSCEISHETQSAQRIKSRINGATKQP